MGCERKLFDGLPATLGEGLGGNASPMRRDVGYVDRCRRERAYQSDAGNEKRPA
jgi:hypothetical protein